MGGAGTEDAITSASRGVSERVASLRSDDWTSSISAVSVVLTDTLASMTKHSCGAFADVALSRGTCS